MLENDQPISMNTPNPVTAAIAALRYPDFFIEFSWKANEPVGTVFNGTLTVPFGLYFLLIHYFMFCEPKGTVKVPLTPSPLVKRFRQLTK